MTNPTIGYSWKALLLLVLFQFILDTDVKAFNCDNPTISVSDTVEVCREDSGVDSTYINFNNQVEGSAGTWSQDVMIPGFNLSFPLDSVSFIGAISGCFPFTFTTNTAEPPCTDTMATMIVCVNACPCPSPATDFIPDICENDSYNLQDFQLTTDPGSWSVISGPDSQDISSIITDTIFDATGILPGPYVVRFTLDNPGNELCDTFSEQTFNVFTQDSISVLGIGQLCNIEDAQFPDTLDLYSLISVDSADIGTWMQIGTETSIPIIDGSIISSDSVTDFSQTFTFRYFSWQIDGPCPPIQVDVMVNIFDCTCAIIMLDSDTLCNDGIPIDLFTLLTNDENVSGTWSTNGNLVGASMFDPLGLPSGLYDITFTLDSVPDPDCAEEFHSDILVRNQASVEVAAGTLPCSMDIGNGSTSVNLYDWLVPGYSSGFWEQIGGDTLPFSDDGISTAIVDFEGQAIGATFTFVFITTSAQYPCENKSVEIAITVVDCPCPPIELSNPDSITNDTATFDLCSLLGISDPGTFTVFSESGDDLSANIDSTGCIFNVSNISHGTYSIIYTLDVQVPSFCIQSDTVSLDVLEVLSINTITKENIQIHPNPTREMLSIKSDFNITSLRLYSATGIGKFETQVSGVEHVEMDLSSYPSGIYLLQVSTEKGSWIEKVIKI